LVVVGKVKRRTRRRSLDGDAAAPAHLNVHPP